MNITKLLLFSALTLLATASHSQQCGTWTTMTAKVKPPNGTETVGPIKARRFSDGSIAVRTQLAVNPDGADLSYTKEDHGFTYINNGLGLWENGASIRCDLRENSAHCRAKFKDAEAKDFAPGTAEFCVFGMVVETISPNSALQPCKGDRIIAGNGKGRPKALAPVKNLTGQMMTPYQSQTSLKHQISIDGATKTVSIDSATVPTAVYPKGLEMKGQLVWAQYSKSGRSVVTVAGDAGPAFGEGSIAMHQMLVDGKLTPQLAGPIPASERCKANELKLPHPFVSRPDDGDKDSCKATMNKPATSTDIRAYGGLATVNFVILGKGNYEEAKKGAIKETLTIDGLRSRFLAHGYSEADMAQKIACLDKP
jgi:hypothetical protein